MRLRIPFSLYPSKVSAFFCLFSLSLCLSALLFFIRQTKQSAVAASVQISSEHSLREAMEVDWDLHAVVRGCTASSSSSAAASSAMERRFEPASCAPFSAAEESASEPFETRKDLFLEELHELYKPFLPPYEPLFSHRNNPVSSPLAVEGSKQSGANLTQKRPFPSVSAIAAPAPFKASSSASRSKKRKTQMKVVRQVPAEKVSSDEWAWRKYGQKPIKGSPYPRSYYRCSSSKGCLARKQVERNRSDPGIFIVTYTSEHNHPAPTHRSSLAGSTRPKTSTPETEVSIDSAAAATTTPLPSGEEEAALVPQTTSSESGDYSQSSSMQDNDGEDESGSPDVALSDDFFVGLEGLLSPRHGDSFPDPSESWFGFSWSAGDTVTAAGM